MLQIKKRYKEDTVIFMVSCGDCPKTVLNAINVTYIRNVLSVIQENLA
jgi:hypothetical protein